MEEVALNQTALKKASFLAKFELTKANISRSAKAANVSRKTYYNWCHDDPEFAEKATEIIEGTGDFVESKLIGRINADDTTAMIFYCKTKLKDRGYVERSEVTGKDSVPLNSQTIIVVESSVKDMVKKLDNEF